MQLLESAMAFAVVMIVFSTVATALSELALRANSMRSKCLRKAVENLFDTVIWPRMSRAPMAETGAEEESNAKNRIRDDFLDGLLNNPASGADFSNSLGWVDRKVFNGGLGGFAKDKQISTLTPRAFAERLGRTEIGMRMLAEGEAEVGLLVEDFVRTFDRFSHAAGEVFRRNAQLVAMVMAIFLAFAANIDAGRVFTALMKDPDLRRELIDDAQQAIEENNKTQAEFQRVAEQAIERASAGALTPDDEREFTDARARARASLAEIETFKDAGLPIGADYFPHCYLQESRCSEHGREYDGGTFFVWLFMTALAGVLIGLGGPFWFRVFASLSQVFQLLRAVGHGRDRPETRPEAAPTSKGLEQSFDPDTVVDAFKTAARVHAGRGYAAGRALLNPDGRALEGREQ